MAASEATKRTIVRGCKYQAIARVVQHDEAKMAISQFIKCKENHKDIEILNQKAKIIRNRIHDNTFDKDMFAHNADYIECFANNWSQIVLPNADFLDAGKDSSIEINSVKVTIQIQFRLQRITKTNRARVGAGMLRYAKGKPLKEAVGKWQSAFLFGYLNETKLDDGLEVEQAMCITIDAFSGTVIPAPSDSLSRFKNMAAACATIAERWPNIKPPPNAVL
ncbi:hypothetical protein SAE02_51110 [Skermanella aerolata]|uniref:Uncharacterized protein n=1 Tax=Skermanella aerolata TaxID=393310 RepID=A0A512DWX0_9PROT|nr:hypothetical protein [Skermanella aerolata]GEO40963.1 hypothetical protein SAE02_51110 [Skermanella aerolata]